MIIGAEVLESGKLLISCYDEQGKIKYIERSLPDHELFNWVESQVPSPIRNWNGKSIKKSKSNGKYVNQFRVQELIQERLSTEEKDYIYSFDNTPKKSYLDIEIKLTDDGFPDPERARMPVGLISFCNEDNNIYVLSIMTDDDKPDGFNQDEITRMEEELHKYLRKTVPLRPQDKELFDQEFKIRYKFFKSEVELMEFYYHKIVPKHSFVTGWNVTDFDWKYLMNRCKNIKVDSMATMPSRSTVGKNKIPVHLGLLDYMQVFEKLKPYKVVENYKLDYVAELVLGVNKLKHDYPTMREFQKDTFLFTLYNVIDVVLVKLMEDKMSLLDVAYSIANVAQVEVNKVFSPVYVAEILMCREFLNQGKRMMKLPWGEEIEDGTYAGAYVKDPIPGYYNSIACYDFSSMYPNIQIQFNISPDSYLGKTDEVRRNGTEISTKNNTLFSSQNDSAARTILTRLYDGRIETQTEIKQLKSKLND
jgi:DNA polymerase elongation subunit (family B)